MGEVEGETYIRQVQWGLFLLQNHQITETHFALHQNQSLYKIIGTWGWEGDQEGVGVGGDQEGVGVGGGSGRGGSGRGFVRGGSERGIDKG